MKKVNLLFVAAIATGLIQACSGSKSSSNSSDSSSSSTTTTSTSDSSKMTAAKSDSSSTMMADTTFASKAAIGGMAEVALGKMASEKSTDPKIKNFGKMMVMDHSKANTELKSIAKKENIMLPAGLDAAHQAKSDSLSKLSSKDFDKAYVQAMVEGHKMTLALMQKEASNGKDTSLKAFATKTAPVVQTHLTKITMIQSEMK